MSTILMRFLSHCLNFLIALFFALVGLICLLIYFSFEIRTAVVSFILESPTLIALYGIVFLLIGFASGLNAILAMRKRIYSIHIASEGSATVDVDVDEAMIEQTINAYWKKLFPKQNYSCAVVLKGQTIHIEANFPYIQPAERLPMIENIKVDLLQLLENTLGKPQKIELAAHFHIPPGPTDPKDV